ncbi:MAG: VWA domain-containing protein [Deltaproteobacteria bacterium]|nr:VWA domain-containing protein [Deltaproteobacteria bacterium]
MRKHWVPTFVAVAAVSAGAFAACSSDSSEDVGAWDGYGGSSSGTTSSTSGGTSTSSSSGSSGTGGAGAGSPNPVAPPGQDAGPDAEFTCEGLDPNSPVVLYISADDSNSMASPGHAREALNSGQAPLLGIRTYEFLNYYNIEYPAAALGQLDIFPQMEAATEAGHYDLQIAVRSFDAVQPRRPMTITFVLDTSGSMGGPAIERERAVVKAIAASLADGDVVSMVTWNTSNNVEMSGHVVSGPNDSTLVAAANALSANGGTDMHAGLVAGYDLADQHYGDSRLNRLVLISDGMANAGVTDMDLIANHSEDGDGEGVYLVGVGVGPYNVYNDELMDTVTDEGRGAYVYVDSIDEATSLFVNRFDEVMEVAARGVQVELTLPWYFEMHKFFGEEYSENPAEVKPQHLAPSDAMIFSQIIRACDPNEVVLSDQVTVKATWETPLTYALDETEITMTLDQLLSGDTVQLHKGKAIVAYAEALKTGTNPDLTAALTVVEGANPNNSDAELNEIADLIQAHPSY